MASSVAVFSSNLHFLCRHTLVLCCTPRSIVVLALLHATPVHHFTDTRQPLPLHVLRSTRTCIINQLFHPLPHHARTSFPTLSDLQVINVDATPLRLDLGEDAMQGRVLLKDYRACEMSCTEASSCLRNMNCIDLELSIPGQSDRLNYIRSPKRLG